MAALRLAAIYRYPLKSAAGLACEQATLDDFGVAGDRRWLLVDPAGDFLSQRRLPALALLRAEERGDGEAIEGAAGPPHLHRLLHHLAQPPIVVIGRLEIEAMSAISFMPAP